MNIVSKISDRKQVMSTAKSRKFIDTTMVAASNA